MAGEAETGEGGRPAARRALLRGAAGLLALGAGGCGFRPIYGNGGIATGEPQVARELAATRVVLIPERFGQLLRRGLQQRLGAGGDGAAPARYELLVAPVVSAEGLGVQRDGSATRVRYIATANWTLVRLSPRETVANGFERTIDAFNVDANQLFAADFSREATERRLADQLAQDVVTRLAVRFRDLGDGAAPRLIEPVPPPPTLPEPTLPAGSGGLLLPEPDEGRQRGLGGGIGPLGTFR